MLLCLPSCGRPGMRMRKIRILLADDHQTILERVCALLGEDFEIVGTVNNGRDAVADTLRLNPDVLVIDISMPLLNGLQAVKQILRSEKQETKVVFLTVHTDQDFVTAALGAGASAYVTKADVATDLVPAIQEALAGRIYISNSITT
jgi:DNA-binding NarL/FixJ family response regulator